MSTRILMRPKRFVVESEHPKYAAPPDMANINHSGSHTGKSNTTTGSGAMVKGGRKRPIGLAHVEAQRAKLPRNCISMYKIKSCEEECKVTVEKDKGTIGIKDEDKTDPQCVVLSCNNATYNSSSSTESVRRKLIFESDPKPAKKEFNRKQMLEKRKASRAKLFDLSRMNYDTSLLDKQSEKEVILVKGQRKRKGNDISNVGAKSARVNDSGEILEEIVRRSGARRVKKAVNNQLTPLRRSSRLIGRKLNETVELAADNPKSRNNKRRSNDDDNKPLVLVNQENTEVNKEVETLRKRRSGLTVDVPIKKAKITIQDNRLEGKLGSTADKSKYRKNSRLTDDDDKPPLVLVNLNHENTEVNNKVERLSKKRRSGLTVDVPIKKAKVIVQDNCMDKMIRDSINNSNDVKPALRRRSARIMEKLTKQEETPRYCKVQNKESSAATEENKSEETIKEFTTRCLRHFISIKKPSVNLNKLVKINNSPKWASQRSVTLHQLVLSGVVLE